MISEITAGAREQTSGIEQVNTAVAEMDTMTQQNASMVHQNAGLAATMRDNARRLDELMSEFILGEARHTETRPSPSMNRTSPALPSAVTTPSQQAVKRAPKRQQPVRELEEDWETF
ncbi:hypothetical protein Q427_14845 [Halomonas sp. BC04]|nr:hypothetical protein Q427_14845 [Halomonas sp. BC04]